MIDFHKGLKPKPAPGAPLDNASIYDAVMILKKHGIEVSQMQHMMTADQYPKMDMTFSVYSKSSQDSYTKALDFAKAWTTPYKKY